MLARLLGEVDEFRGGGFGLPLQLHCDEISRRNQKWDSGSFIPAARFDQEPHQHVKVSVDHAVRHCVYGAAANVSRLQFRSIRGCLFVGKGLILRRGNLRAATHYQRFVTCFYFPWRMFVFLPLCSTHYRSTHSVKYEAKAVRRDTSPS